MYNEKDVLELLRVMQRNGKLPMFFAELRQSIPSGKSIVHFGVVSLNDDTKFQVSFRPPGNVKSIQGFTKDFDSSQVVRGYELTNGELTLVFGPKPTDYCTCPIGPAVALGLKCPYCGAVSGATQVATPAPVAGSNFPTVEELLRDAFDSMNAPLLSSRVDLLASTLSLSEQEVLEALAITRSDYELDAIYKRSLEFFGHDLNVPLVGELQKSFSWAEYVEIIKPYHKVKFGICAPPELSHEWFINTVGPHVGADVTIRLELYNRNVIYVEGFFTTNPDFVQDFGWLFGQCFSDSSGVKHLALCGFSFNHDGGYENFTRNTEVVKVLPLVYNSTIRLMELVKAYSGVPLYAGSLIDVVDVLDDGTFVVCPAANHDVQFKIPCNFKGASRFATQGGQ